MTRQHTAGRRRNRNPDRIRQDGTPASQPPQCTPSPPPRNGGAAGPGKFRGSEAASVLFLSLSLSGCGRRPASVPKGRQCSGRSAALESYLVLTHPSCSLPSRCRRNRPAFLGATAKLGTGNGECVSLIGRQRRRLRENRRRAAGSCEALRRYVQRADVVSLGVCPIVITWRRRPMVPSWEVGRSVGDDVGAA